MDTPDRNRQRLRSWLAAVITVVIICLLKPIRTPFLFPAILARSLYRG